MFQLKLADTQNRKVIDKKGNITIFEYDHDMSVEPGSAMYTYYASKMNVRRRQVLFELNGNNAVIVQAGAMQWMAGAVEVATNVKGVGDFAKKLISSKVTNEIGRASCRERVSINV